MQINRECRCSGQAVMSYRTLNKHPSSLVPSQLGQSQCFEPHLPGGCGRQHAAGAQGYISSHSQKPHGQFTQQGSHGSTHQGSHGSVQHGGYAWLHSPRITWLSAARRIWFWSPRITWRSAARKIWRYSACIQTGTPWIIWSWTLHSHHGSFG